MYEIKHVRDHIEVFLNGEFQFSADTVREAHQELEEESKKYYEREVKKCF